MPTAFSPDEKIAFISVFDKTGLEPVARALVEQYGYTLLSTGGTHAYLTERGIPVRDSAEITGFGELLGGRVKSLHPEIFAAILAERHNPEHTAPFYIETVIVNLYPFEQERQNPTPTQDPNHLLHFIDIGGSSLLRAAGKNYLTVNVLNSPKQYEAFLKELRLGQGETSLPFRRRLAQEAFQRSVAYDTAIAGYFADSAAEPDALPAQVTLSLHKIQDLRYGENPHQQAALYGLETAEADFQLLHGKPLSYNNILDLEAGWNIVTEFEENAACAIIKHNNPCGVALSQGRIDDAYLTAFDADPLSAFGGVVALNRPVNLKTAEHMREVFLEVVIAPDFEPEAQALLQEKKNLRLVKRPLPVEKPAATTQYKQVSPHLFLVQQTDHLAESRIEALLQEEGLQVVTEKKPTADQLQDLLFAWRVVKHVKSNAIVVAKAGKTVGIGGGQTSRIGALENALKQACEEASHAVMASDGFFPAEDNIHAAAQARVEAIIQPGGSIKDPDVIALANRYQIAMVTTGLREFKH